MTIEDLVQETMRLRERFQRQEKREWTIEVMATELMAEVGTLADCIMIKEGYRKSRTGELVNFADELADVLFVVVLIAQHYGIEIEGAYLSMLKATHRKLDHRT